MSNLLQLFRVGGEIKVDGRNERMKAMLAKLERDERRMMEAVLQSHGWKFRDIDLEGGERWEYASPGIAINMEFGEAYNFVTKHECD